MESSNKKDYYCPLCKYKCANKRRLEEHMTKHTREKPWSCEKCSKAFAVKDYLARHVRSVHQQSCTITKKLHKCSLCSYATKWRSALKVHMRTHSAERNYPCEQANCDHAAKSSAELKMHNIYKHKIERKFGCPFPNCDYRGKIKTDVSRHAYMRHSDGRPFVCDFEGCNYRAKRKLDLKAHKLDVHHGGYKPFACSLCSHRTTSKARLKIHELVHADEKPVKCHFDGCTYSCTLNTNLRKHVLSRHTEKTLKCDFAGCFYTTANRVRLKSHVKYVHGEKVHKCPSCDYRATIPWKVQVHFDRHHTSQRVSCPYEECNYQARRRDTLNRHIKCHKANLGCPVEGCDYAASSRSAWKRHMLFHDPTRRSVHCPLCPKHFAKNDHLSEHLRRHTQEKPFKCPACNFEGVSKVELTRHAQRIHSRAFPDFVFDDEAICAHCDVNFGCPLGLAMHAVTLKTAVVVLNRLHVKFNT